MKKISTFCLRTLPLIGIALGFATAVRADQALVIGVNQYTALRPGSNLEGCVNDAKRMKAVFEKYGFTVNLLTDKDATKEGVMNAIKQLSAVKPDVLFCHDPNESNEDHNQLGKASIIAASHTECFTGPDEEPRYCREIYKYTTGWQSQGFTPDTIDQVKRAYRLLLLSKLNTSRALVQIEQDPTLTSPEVTYLVDFIRSSSRGVILRRPARRTEELVSEE